MNRFERVVQILDESIGGPNAGFAAHGPFWRGQTRDEFIATNVFGFDLVAVGDGASSNLVKALKGEAPFGVNSPNPPAGAEMPRMPFGFAPVSADNIRFIEQWIDDGCHGDADGVTATLSWRPTSAPRAKRYDDIWFVTPELGWAVNSSGQILRTADGGASWQLQFQVPSPPGRPVWLRCVGFATESRGWVGTTSGKHRLFETTDGGANWSPVTNLPADAPNAVCGLSVVNESVVYASGTNFPFPVSGLPPRMMKTVDGGETWTAWDMTAHAALLVDTYFTSAQEGWVVGGKVHPVTPGAKQCTLPPNRADIKPVVLHTTDGGETWTNQVADIEDDLSLGEWGWKIFFLNAQVGFVSLENFCEAAILKTTNAGQTWERLAVNDPQKNANLEGLGFADEIHGWVGGWGSADMLRGSSSETTDGGQTWSDIDWGEPSPGGFVNQDKPSTGEFLNRFRFFGDPVTLGYASGNTVYKYSAEPAPVSLAVDEALEATLFDDPEPAETPRPVSMHITVPGDASRLSINVWDRFGAHVRELVDETHPAAGRRTVNWDLSNDAGDQLEPGYYIARATADDRAQSKIFWITD